MSYNGLSYVNLAYELAKVIKSDLKALNLTNGVSIEKQNKRIELLNKQSQKSSIFQG